MPKCELVPEPRRCQNENRSMATHSSLGYRTPTKFAEQLEILSYDWLRKSRQVNGAQKYTERTQDVIENTLVSLSNEPKLVPQRRKRAKASKERLSRRGRIPVLSRT